MKIQLVVLLALVTGISSGAVWCSGVSRDLAELKTKVQVLDPLRDRVEVLWNERIAVHKGVPP